MNRKDLLFEIGVEEIPAGYIKDAIDKIADKLTNCLKENRLDYKSIKTFSTPRRFAVIINQVVIKQDDQIIERVGPAVKTAYDEKGELTRAALGFLKGAGANFEDIFEVESPKGKKIAVKIDKKGKFTEDIFKETIINIITQINFPKTMRWNSDNFVFARPIRWIVALWDSEILNIEINGLKAGNISYGNRFMKNKNSVKIDSVSHYEDALKSVFVVADREQRKQLINKQISNITDQTGLAIIEDNNLLDIITDLVEYPTAVLAQFNQNYLIMPEKIITSTLSQNQKYFSMTRDGKLIDHFIFISNGDPQSSDIIRKGNEKVIKARLDDAEFFFKEDTKIPLENYVKYLSEVTFQEKLGTLLDKTNRNIALVQYLAEKLELNDQMKIDCTRTAKLAKADLVTLMLGEKEFTKLQGYIGWKYALISGEKPDVAKGIYEHYQPRGQNDSLPTTKEGALVALADKVDTVCGIIGVGMMPTGSKDPFALRRAANGVIQIIADNSFDISLTDFLVCARQSLIEKVEISDLMFNDIKEFFKQRVYWYLQDAGIDYDIIESVMHIDYDNVPLLMKRAKALQSFKDQEDFIKLVIGFKRVSNIIVAEDSFNSVKSELLTEDEEIKLHQDYLKLEAKINPYINKRDFMGIIKLLIQFGISIDRFFNKVLVNVDDLQIRSNRYSLLNQIRKLFLNVADISKIVVDGEIKK